MNQKVMKFLITILGLLFFSSQVFALSQEYTPNYKIEQPWTEIIQLLTKIEAYNGAGKTPPATIFTSLNKDFKTVFDYFPKDPNYKIVYEQCLMTTESLTAGVNYEKYIIFRDRCFDSLNKIIKEINRKYTVVASIKANPTNGSAPLVVTFDGRGSADPSNDTIPSSNYFWYFKNDNGVNTAIGQGPVVNYTFQQAGNYVVHLTVRSANWNTKGIFDGEQSVSINVGPKSAVVSVYANNKKMREDYKVKIGTQEARKGVNFDGSGTYPTGGRKIISYKWEITGEDGFNYTRTGRDNPGSFRVELPGNGEYRTKLTIADNEGNELSEEYALIVSDPIATVKVTPSQGDTTNTYSFDASPSYSIQSKIKNYKWTIYDPNGTQIESFEGKTFQRRFNQPGNYTAKLTVLDDLGNTNDDNVKFYVDSTAPVPQFLVTPVKNWKYASQFVLDGTVSYDYDTLNGSDSLKYEWKMSDNKSGKIERTFDDGQKAIATFDAPGVYRVKLIVTDKYNKISEIEKEIEVKSSLRPEITVNPITSAWGEEVSFNVSSNKQLYHYAWDFGDGKTSDSNSESVSHVYNKAGVYLAKLSVKTPSGEENEVATNVFVGEKGYPILGYSMKVGDRILTTDEICVDKSSGETIDYNAYGVDRYQDFTLDVSQSVNSKGTNEGMKKYFKPQNDQIFTNSYFSYKFSELGCQYVEVWAEDQSTKKVAKQKVWIKVKNSNPVIQGVLLSFPQYGNESGIGFNQNNNQNKDMFVVQYDPLVVKVMANGAKDNDGFISHYMWYYYKTDDPTRILELKITPSNVNYAIFSLPRIPGSYTFGVKITDNDGGEVSSEDILGKGPTVFFPPDTKNLDIPMVTLKTSKVNAKVGEEIKLRVIAKILSNRDDFDSNRVIKYDFDGDGEYDLTTTKDEVAYIYPKEGKFTPKVKVIYRGYGGIGYGESIELKKGLKSDLLYDSFDKNVIVRNVTYGDIEKRNVCMNAKDCTTAENNVKDKDYFVYSYNDYGKYVIKSTVNDKYGNETSSVTRVDVTSSTGSSGLMSIPNASSSKTGYNIQVGQNLDNSVLFYFSSSGSGNCYIDTDITNDSDKDGNPDQDKDISCNELILQKYEPKAASTIARVYYTLDGKTATKDIIIDFLDFDIKLTDDQKKIYDELNSIIDSIDGGTDTNAAYLKTLLVNLRNGIGDKTEIDSLLIQTKQFMDENKENSTVQTVKPKVDEVLDKLVDKGTKAALGGTPYDSAKADILMFIPDESKSQVEGIFKQIDEIGGDKDKVKSLLQSVLDIAESAVKAGSMDESSLTIVKNDVCEILQYFEIPSTACGTETAQAPASSSSGSLLWTILKVLGVILLVVVIAFGALIVVFAIRAKKQQKETTEENDQTKNQ